MPLMRRQSLVKFDAPLCEIIVETPKPVAKEVLVRIERCGLCHSDLHIQDGYADLGGGKKLDTTRGMTLPFTLGHEIAGIVEEVGPDVSKDLIGTRKAVFPWIGCGQCRDCLQGDETLCPKQRFLGVTIDGGFASHVLVPDAKYLLDYDPLPVNQAATLMCSRVTAYGALKRLVDRPRQRNLLLIGLGGVGDGARLCPGHVQAKYLGSGFEYGRARGGAAERRQRRLRSFRNRRGQAHHQGNRRRL
jgi:alcohol dehydrogenase